MASLGSYIDILQPSSSQRFACLGADLHAEAWEPPSTPQGTLYHSHGVCESNHTVTVQRLARACVDGGWRLVSLEHEGHGLSSGARACADLGRLSEHLAAFVAKELDARPAGEPWALSGHSMGAVVALYSAHLPRSATGPRWLAARRPSASTRCRRRSSSARCGPLAGSRRRRTSG
ncbi:alpha/beta hydrolase [Aureococcus anophagefferens]|nr:alpha/beta hydrolase [Aureococcus anophagefferens]